jgi:hypothetical protein
VTSDENLDLRTEFREIGDGLRRDLRDLRRVVIRWYVAEIILMLVLLVLVLARGG